MFSLPLAACRKGLVIYANEILLLSLSHPLEPNALLAPAHANAGQGRGAAYKEDTIREREKARIEAKENESREVTEGEKPEWNSREEMYEGVSVCVFV